MSETGSGKRPGQSEEHVVQRATHLAQIHRAIRLSRHRMAPLMNFSKFHFITSLSIKFSQKFVPFINPKSFTLFRMILRDKAAYFNGPPSCEKVDRLPVAFLSRILCEISLVSLFVTTL